MRVAEIKIGRKRATTMLDKVTEEALAEFRWEKESVCEVKGRKLLLKLWKSLQVRQDNQQCTRAS